MHGCSNRGDSISKMAATAAILKIYFRLLLQNCLSDWAEIWYGASGQPVDARLFKSWRFDIQYGCHGGHLENLFSTSSPEPLVGLSWNLVWSIGTTSRCTVVLIVAVRYPIWAPQRPSWRSIFDFFSRTACQIELKFGMEHWHNQWMHGRSNCEDSITNMAAMVAILKIYFRLPLQNRLSDWAKIWYGASGQPVDTRLFKSWQYYI